MRELKRLQRSSEQSPGASLACLTAATFMRCAHKPPAGLRRSHCCATTARCHKQRNVKFRIMTVTPSLLLHLYCALVLLPHSPRPSHQRYHCHIAGHAISRTYLETLADLPWNTFATQPPPAAAAKPAAPNGAAVDPEAVAQPRGADGQQEQDLQRGLQQEGGGVGGVGGGEGAAGRDATTAPDADDAVEASPPAVPEHRGAYASPAFALCIGQRCWTGFCVPDVSAQRLESDPGAGAAGCAPPQAGQGEDTPSLKLTSETDR